MHVTVDITRCLYVERVSTPQLAVIFRHVRCSAHTRKNVSTALSVTLVSRCCFGCCFLFSLVNTAGVFMNI